MGDKRYYVYIVTNNSYTSLDTGMTSNLDNRVDQHRDEVVDGFTKRYKTHILVYFEETSDVRVALEQEKQIKGWTRAKKIALIESLNPGWRNLAVG